MNQYITLYELFEKYKDDLYFDLPKEIHNYSLKREAGLDAITPSLELLSPILAKEIKEILSIKDNFLRDYISAPFWPSLVLSTFFSHWNNNESIMLTSFPMFKEMNKIKRTGINLYKRDGWGVHVIMGLYVSNLCIPNGIVPATISETVELESLFKTSLRDTYNSLTEQDKILFRIGTLIHDLGVVDGVANHDAFGVKYVEGALKQLDITPSWLKTTTLKHWAFEEVEVAIKIFVEYHALLSKVFGEYGLNQLKLVLEEINNKAKIGPNCQKWTQTGCIPSLALFLYGDVASVRDEYLTSWKIKLTQKATNLLNEMSLGKKPSIELKEYGAERLCESLALEGSENVKKMLYCNFKDISDIEDILFDIGTIQRMDYALAALKQLPNSIDRMRILIRLVSILRERTSWNKAKWREIKFNPSISKEWLTEISSEKSSNWHERITKKIIINDLDNKCVVLFAEAHEAT